jgi:hypothetical protein
MKQKHADLIHAWANGAQIQSRNDISGSWEDNRLPMWAQDTMYRIKPEPKPDVVVYSRIMGKFKLTNEGIEIQQLIVCELKDRPNIKYTFDGEWGNLKSAEVLK